VDWANAIDILEEFSARLEAAVVLCEEDGRIRWVSQYAERQFPGAFAPAAEFRSSLDALFEDVEPAYEAHGLLDCDREDSRLLRLRHDARGDPVDYRHIAFETNGHSDTPGLPVHCLIDCSRERRLEDSYRTNLAQLSSMREIADTLYEGLSYEEVIYLILIAVTAHLGFGFNRAFYLEAIGDRLRGTTGIGPSNAEEAHAIWQRLERSEPSSIRTLYREIADRDERPDSRTHELAAQMNFPLCSADSLLMVAVGTRKPGLLHARDSEHPLDRELFELLNTDAVAIVPLYVRQSLAGVLVADNFITRSRITERDLEVLRSFSRYAGLALERSQLYDELRQSVHKLQEANETLKTNQLRLLQAEKLSAIGELAACVSHEIRNPLVAIGGLARALQRDTEITDKNRATLEMIADQVARLEKFLRETLDFVKPEVTGTISVDLRDEIQRAIAPLEHEIAERSIELELELSPQPVRCLIAPDLFHRALTNLVLNAAEALGKAGRILITARVTDQLAVVEVVDTGPGIPPELHSKVFDPFFTTRAEGTGLGLAIAAQAIRTIGGQISLQADDPFKTIFRIMLPLEANLVRNLSRAGGATAPPEGSTVPPEGRDSEEFVKT